MSQGADLPFVLSLHKSPTNGCEVSYERESKNLETDSKIHQGAKKGLMKQLSDPGRKELYRIVEFCALNGYPLVLWN